ncbi:DoxX family protein [Listeria immobilis]|uniref:DoxX family protein n=1 Tax=Listeria immobilis TaxID=2713502 RepID=A0ABR6SX49_9LIST|nr:DoxX family protein [Listeria immobilis]MBC1482851.1 DoxX family protein [Listeria immobilis]MBC1506978.1 DoxX family protein [Listeria immobilis]MBC1510189.1 DoxX family protein [Listeria immobilis]MBC1516812.1 DoxX family protein [Listeria immobilis]MBC6303313.1 DoxX family protein [Listeria immobilis]
MLIVKLSANILFSIIRVGLGISWLYQGWFKIQAHFDISGLVPSVIGNTDSPDWYKAFMENIVGPNTALFNILIPWGELLVGLGLIVGALTLPALIAGIFMGINYWLADMIYIYPIQLAIGIVLLLCLKQANYFSLTNLFIFFRTKQRNKT